MGYPEDNFKGAKGFLDTGKRYRGGRKPKLIKAWLKECPVERHDAEAMLKGVLFGYTLEGLEKVLAGETDNISVATRILINAAVNAAKKGRFDVMQDMLEFIYGKPSQRVEVSGGTAAIVVLPAKETDGTEGAEGGAYSGQPGTEGVEAPPETGGGFKE
jgi:hypothetical protein